MADILNKLNSTNYVTVKVTDDAVINGNNLLAAYALAKTTNPNGLTKSSTNRLTIILPSATYDLGTQSLTLDTQYVDIVGSTTNRNSHYIKSNISVVNRGTVMQTANDVRLVNLTIENSGARGATETSDEPSAYWPDSNLPLTYIKNVIFLRSSIGIFSTRKQVNYSGTYINCTGGNYLFGGNEGTGGTASGTFTDCTGGNYSFGGGTARGGTASGTFTNCTGGDYSFAGSQLGNGGTIDSTAVLTNCTGGNYSFGGGPSGGGTASGTFTNCSGGIWSFASGGLGVVNGTFINCIGGRNSFNQ